MTVYNFHYFINLLLLLKTVNYKSFTVKKSYEKNTYKHKTNQNLIFTRNVLIRIYVWCFSDWR